MAVVPSFIRPSVHVLKIERINYDNKRLFNAIIKTAKMYIIIFLLIMPIFAISHLCGPTYAIALCLMGGFVVVMYLNYKFPEK